MQSNFPNINEIGAQTPDATIATKLSIIIASQANDLVVRRLIDGAKRSLLTNGIPLKNQYLLQVPGALEIPMALKRAVLSGKFSIFVVVGAVIKGKTDHYDHVARMANDGTLNIAIRHGLALGNGILTVHSLEHALERADGPNGNLGYDAANAAIKLHNSFLELEKVVNSNE